MNERIKNRIKLVSSFLMCVLSLSAAITLSFAWFAKNDTVNGGGMSVAIENDANVVGAEYFIAEKSDSQSSSSELKFTKITDGNPVRMGAYDILDKKYQLLAKVYLKSDMETIRVTGNTQTAYFLGALENNKSKYPLLPPTSSDHNVPQEGTAGGVTYTNVLSSVINFTIFQADELTALTNGSGYELVSDTLPSGNRIAKFIDSTDAEKPTSSINLVQTEGSNTVTTGGPEEFNGQPCRTLFIMFSYDEAIMEKIFSDNLGNTNIYVENNDGTLINIPFKCDFTISFEKFAG